MCSVAYRRAAAVPSDRERGIEAAECDCGSETRRRRRKSGGPGPAADVVGPAIPRAISASSPSNSPPSTSSTPSDRSHGPFSGAYRPYAQMRAGGLSRRALLDDGAGQPRRGVHRQVDANEIRGRQRSSSSSRPSPHRRTRPPTPRGAAMPRAKPGRRADGPARRSISTRRASRSDHSYTAVW